MKVVLLQDVKAQGKKDQVVEVSDGYARNFLFPKKLAVPADAKVINDIKNKQSSAKHKEEVERMQEPLQRSSPKLQSSLQLRQAATEDSTAQSPQRILQRRLRLRQELRQISVRSFLTLQLRPLAHIR